MCGIAGAVQRGRVATQTLERMADALAHRGPDGEGVHRSARFTADGQLWQAGLAHRRLAVFDPTPAGRQPMTSRSGRTTAVLNGEIYNHPELRRRLPGFAWRTRTDTEVLIELWEAHGPRVLDWLNGMFAFAIWEPDERRLWVARDRMGVKPLYYRENREGLVFGSELTAVLAGPEFERRLDVRALSSYLDFGFAPAPTTLLEGVRKLEPGGLLRWEAGRLLCSRWWRTPGPAAPDHAPAGWREDLYTSLVDGVRLRLRSDVPVGSFLSGGVDSTLISALAVRERPDLRTFSVRFRDCPRLDESRYARAAARALGTRHREISLGAEDVVALAPRVLDRMDEPFADSSLLPVSFLCEHARREVTVALSGDGADELFAGYRRYTADRWLARWERVPAGARRRVLEPLIRSLGTDRATRRGELGRRARKVLSAQGLSPESRALAVARIFGANEKAALLRSDRQAGDGPSLSVLRRLGAEHRGSDGLDTRLRVDLALGLPDDMLTKVDRGSMAHGLEVRVPFLDPRVVACALGLPSRLKLRRGRSKLALREVFSADLPAPVRRRRKAGFDAPLGGWLRGPLRELARDVLSEDRLSRGGLLEPRAVNRLLDDHDRGLADHSWRLWSLLVLESWTTRHGVS